MGQAAWEWVAVDTFLKWSFPNNQGKATAMKTEINEQDLHTAAVMIGPLLANLSEKWMPDGSRVMPLSPSGYAEHIARAYQAIQSARALLSGTQ